MTEDEAKTKWCPFARIVVTPTGLIMTSGRTAVKNDGAIVSVEDHCIGPACMAWRWSLKPEGGKFCRVRNKDGSTVVVRKTTAAAYKWDVVDGDGFCGLSGRPA